MDINPIDIKIKEFALYLKDFGLLNETNINDFLKKFKNISENSITSSGILETDINVGLIYLKENLSKTMLEFYNLMTEERKKITYLNIYSKFIQKREKELQDKGKKVYAIYATLPIKKFFNNWKTDNKNNNKNKTVGDNICTFKKPNIFQDLKKDNFCFDIISNNDYFNNNNNNIVINSNNNKILFNTNSSTKFNSTTNLNNNSLMNSNGGININSFLLTSKGRLTDFNLVDSYNKNKDKDKLAIYQKPQINKENILDRLFYPNKTKKELNEEKKYNLYQSNNSNNYNNKNSYNIMRHSVEPKNRINNIKQNNINNINNNNFSNRKTYNNYYKEKEDLNSDKFSTPINKMRNSYNSSRPKSSLNNNNNINLRYSERNSISSVYQRLYDQNKEKIKRQEERIKENINEIKERANHPIQKKKNYNNFRNVNKNLKCSNSNNMHTNKYKLNNNNSNKNINFTDKKNISKKIDEIMLDKSLKEKKSNNFGKNENKMNKNDEQKRKDGQNFIENQRKCIELFNDMIEKEEKNGGKNFNENEKENMFKDLLNKLYKENQNNKKNNNDNINEDEKVNEINSNK